MIKQLYIFRNLKDNCFAGLKKLLGELITGPGTNDSNTEILTNGSGDIENGKRSNVQTFA